MQESVAANRAALVQHGILNRLLSLALAGGGVASPPVRTQVCFSSPAFHSKVEHATGRIDGSDRSFACAGVQALVCMEQLIAGQPKHQEVLMMAKVADSQGGDIPALQAVLRVSPSLATAMAVLEDLAAWCSVTVVLHKRSKHVMVGLRQR